MSDVNDVVFFFSLRYDPKDLGIERRGRGEVVKSGKIDSSL